MKSGDDGSRALLVGAKSGRCSTYGAVAPDPSPPPGGYQYPQSSYLASGITFVSSGGGSSGVGLLAVVGVAVACAALVAIVVKRRKYVAPEKFAVVDLTEATPLIEV